MPILKMSSIHNEYPNYKGPKMAACAHRIAAPCFSAAMDGMGEASAVSK